MSLCSHGKHTLLGKAICFFNILTLKSLSPGRQRMENQLGRPTSVRVLLVRRWVGPDEERWSSVDVVGS